MVVSRRGVAWWWVAAALLWSGCAGELEEEEEVSAPGHAGFTGEEEVLGGEEAEALKGLPPSARVEDAVYGTCTTSSLRGLSDELMAEVACMRPGVMARIDDIPNVSLGGAVVPWLQAPAAAALRRAASRRALVVNSALRTLPQQYLLYRWYQAGRCGITLAAPPGRSNHEGGLAVDIDNYSAARSSMGSAGWRWLGGSDPWHFDYVGAGGVELGSLSVLAFQRLWNRHNAGDRISEDGAWGPATASRLAKAPLGGFGGRSACGAAEPAPAALPALAVSWSRGAGGVYALEAEAPAGVSRVEYFVDGYKIAGASRGAGRFAASYTFQQEGEGRRLEAVGLGSDGREVALGVGALDVTSGVGVYIRQRGAGVYEVGLERAPAAVAAVEVDVDGWPLVDGVSGARRSTRGAVRARLSQGGERTFEVRTYNADGSYRGTLRRTLEVSGAP